MRSGRGENGRRIELLTPTLIFNEVPAGEPTACAIVFSVPAGQAVTFQVVDGPTVTGGRGAFRLLPSPNAALSAAETPASREARLWISFAGNGGVAAGALRVRLAETGEEWPIALQARAVARPSVAAIESGRFGMLRPFVAYGA